MTATGDGSSHQELTSELAALDRQLRDLSQQWEDVERTITEKTRRRRELIARQEETNEDHQEEINRLQSDVYALRDRLDQLRDSHLDIIAQLFQHLGRSIGAAFQGDEGHDRLSSLLVAPATDRGFCDLGMVH